MPSKPTADCLKLSQDFFFNVIGARSPWVTSLNLLALSKAANGGFKDQKMQGRNSDSNRLNMHDGSSFCFWL